MVNKKTPNVYLPSSLLSLSAKELYLYSKIPLYRLNGFISGEFRPNKTDRAKLTDVGAPFYSWSKLRRHAYVSRKKWRAVKKFLSLTEKQELFSDPENYEERLDGYVDKYWAEIVAVLKTKKTS